MPAAGLEPARPFGLEILSLLCLPFHHAGNVGRPLLSGPSASLKPRLLHRLHRHIGRGRGHMRQRRDTLAQKAAVSGDVAGAHLQEVVERRSHHVTFLDLRDRQHRAVERLQGRLARVRQTHLDESHMRQPHADRVQHRPIARNHPRILQPLDPRLCRGFRQPDTPRQFRHRHAPIARQLAQDRMVEPVQIGLCFGTAHGLNFGPFT